MIRILIIEDELPARKKLRRFIEALSDSTKILAEVGTITEALEFLSKSKVDVIFSDIELLDGNAFEIYEQIQVTCPIIFATAYDQFWMSAFETNGVAYLLKPFSQEQFNKAWNKFLGLRIPTVDNNWMAQLSELMKNNTQQPNYKKRFTVNGTQDTYFLEIENIQFFTAEEGVVFAIDLKSKKHLLTETTLKSILERLDPQHFFKINRSQIVHKPHVESLQRYSKNAIAIKLKNHHSHLVTSQNNTAEFKLWVES